MKAAVQVCVPAGTSVTVRLAEPPDTATVPSTVAPSVNRTVPPTPAVTAACRVTERAGVEEAVRLVVVGVAAMSTTDSADCEATKAEESAGTNSAVKRCVPRRRSVAWNNAVPPASVTVPMTTAPSRSWTVPCGVPDAAVTVAVRVAVRPLALVARVVVVGFATTGSVTGTVRSGDADPS